MDFNIDIRKKQLESLDQFLTSSKNKLQSVLKCLGWSAEKIEKEKDLVICPYDTGHKIPVDRVVQHVEKCKIKRAGYELQEEFLSEPADHPKESTIRFDNTQKIGILSRAIMQNPFFQPAWNGQDPNPQTHSRLMTTFSRDERLTLYDYSIANTKGPPKLPEFDVSTPLKHEGNEGDPNNEKALISLERDIKRRSVKYKPVHTNQKNYKEVLREVINSQMQQYVDWLAQDKPSKGPRTPEYNNEDEHKNTSVESMNRSHSSSRNSSRSRTERTPDYYHRRHGRREDYSVNKYKNYHDDEDSQDSKCTSYEGSSTQRSEVKSEENYEKSRSRDSSGHSSYRNKDEYRRKRRYRSRSPNERRRHRSRSRHKRNSHESRRREKNVESN